MIRRTEFILSFALVMVLISGCFTAPPIAQVPGLEQTLAVRTMVAKKGVSYFATLTPTPTLTPLPIFNNLTSNYYPTDTSTPVLATPIPSLTPYNIALDVSAENTECLNNAEFVQDVTYDNSAKLKPGERFTKVWRLRNSGTCVWTPDYSVVFTFGDKLGGESPQPIGIEVKPGETVDIALDMVAPKNPDIYSGNWMLQDNQGTIFGCGDSKRNFFWVSIVVGGGGMRKIFGGICGGGG